MVSARDIPGTKLNCLRLLEAVSSVEFRHDAVEGLLKQDPALVYKLLRFLNSPLLGRFAPRLPARSSASKSLTPSAWRLKAPICS